MIWYYVKFPLTKEEKNSIVLLVFSRTQNARVAQLVERDLAKVEAAGSSPVSRSFYFQDLCGFRGIRDPLLVYITKITCGFYLKFSYYHPLPEHLKYFVLV